jgi:protein-disulfide isomerase-like protein with CxxC motif
MAVSVAPLTAVVLGCVPKERAGVASGINNTVAQTANLIAVAVFGALALAAFNGALDNAAASVDAPPAVRAAILDARGNFALTPVATLSTADGREVAETAIRNSLGAGIGMASLLASLLALIGALCAAFTIGVPQRPESKAVSSAAPAAGSVAP